MSLALFHMMLQVGYTVIVGVILVCIIANIFRARTLQEQIFGGIAIIPFLLRLLHIK